MSLDLSLMSSRDLRALQAEIDATMAEAEKRDRQAALDAARAAAAEYGFKLETLMSAPRRTQAGGAPAKYRNPTDPTQTWSGRGRKPFWVHEALSAGYDITDLEIS